MREENRVQNYSLLFMKSPKALSKQEESNVCWDQLPAAKKDKKPDHLNKSLDFLILPGKQNGKRASLDM